MINNRKIIVSDIYLLFNNMCSVFINALLICRIGIELSDKVRIIRKWLIRHFQRQVEDVVGNTSFVWISGIDWSFFDVEMDGIW